MLNIDQLTDMERYEQNILRLSGRRARCAKRRRRRVPQRLCAMFWV